MGEDRLVYVKLIGIEDGGYYRYEFMFSNDISSFSVEGDCDQCCLSDGITPVNHTSTCVVKMKFKLDLIQNSCCFSFAHAAAGIVSLAWENMDDYEKYPDEGRMYFKFGETIDETDSKLHKKGVLMLT